MKQIENRFEETFAKISKNVIKDTELSKIFRYLDNMEELLVNINDDSAPATLKLPYSGAESLLANTWEI